MLRSTVLFSCLCAMPLCAPHVYGEEVPQDQNAPKDVQQDSGVSSVAPNYAYSGNKDTTHIDKIEQLAKANNKKELLEYLHTDEVKNDPQAQYYMGMCYYTGMCFNEKDISKAISWFENSAAQGDDDAQAMLAGIYLDGKDTEKNEERGNYWLNQALEKNNPLALSFLAMQYFNGDGRPQNYAKAREIFEHLAAQNDKFAQFQLGYIYYHGLGSAPDFKKAFEWWKKAADNGVKEAQYDLAGLYYQGEGTAVNKELAQKYLDMSANQGYAKAQYAKGVLLAKDGKDEQALEWFKRAANQGNENALKEVMRIELKTKKLSSVSRDYMNSKSILRS